MATKTVNLYESAMEIARKLVKRVGKEPYSSTDIFNVDHYKILEVDLIQIAQKCKELDLPILSVKVLTKENKIYGGLYNWIQDEYPKYSNYSIERVYNEESNKVDSTIKEKWGKLFIKDESTKDN